MVTKRDRVHVGGFIISEEGSVSRDSGYLAEGENLDAGTLLEENDDGDLVAWTAGDNPVVGILFASTNATVGRTQVATVARIAVVSLDGLSYPEGLAATTRDALANLRIVVLSDDDITDTGEEDSTPDAFSFTDMADADISTVYESNTITVAGINTSADLTVTGGEYQINGGAWGSSATTVVNGDSVKVRATSSDEFETAVNVVLAIGGVSDTFTVTTDTGGGGGGDWILASGSWADAGSWDDSAMWKDAA